MSNTELLQQCAAAHGYEDVEEMLENAVFDSVAAGICTECGYTCEVEPDSSDGWCEECEGNTVKSCLVLAGLM
jgi:rubrerythrin